MAGLAKRLGKGLVNNGHTVVRTVRPSLRHPPRLSETDTTNACAAWPPRLSPGQAHAFAALAKTARAPSPSGCRCSLVTFESKPRHKRPQCRYTNTQRDNTTRVHTGMPADTGANGGPQRQRSTTNELSRPRDHTTIRGWGTHTRDEDEHCGLVDLSLADFKMILRAFFHFCRIFAGYPDSRE